MHSKARVFASNPDKDCGGDFKVRRGTVLHIISQLWNGSRVGELVRVTKVER